MTIKSKIKALGITFLLTLATVPVLGQDLLARQAPVDRRAKKLDSMEVKSFMERENIQTPAAQL